MGKHTDALALIDRAIERNLARGAAKGSPSDLELRELREVAKGLVEALQQSQQWIMQAVIDGSRQPSTATLFRNKAALERAGAAP